MAKIPSMCVCVSLGKLRPLVGGSPSTAPKAALMSSLVRGVPSNTAHMVRRREGGVRKGDWEG